MRAIAKCLIWLWCLPLLSTCTATSEENAQGLQRLPRCKAPKETGSTVIYPQNVSKTPLEVLTEILNMQSDPDPDPYLDLIKSLVTFDATYVSLSFDNPVLHQVML